MNVGEKLAKQFAQHTSPNCTVLIIRARICSHNQTKRPARKETLNLGAEISSSITSRRFKGHVASYDTMTQGNTPSQTHKQNHSG